MPVSLRLGQSRQEFIARTRRRQIRLSNLQKKEVKNLINKAEEKKWFETNFASGQDVTTTMTIQNLTNIAQGDAMTERIGDKIRLRYVNARGYLKGGASSATNTVYKARILLILWKDDSTTNAPTVSQLLEDITDPDSHFNMDVNKRRKFKVLYDRIYKFQKVGSTAGVINPRIYFHKKFKKPIYLNFTDGTTAGKNCVYLCLMSDNASANTIELEKLDVRLGYAE